MNISQNIKDLCEESEISIKELANKIKIQDSLLYKYLNGECLPTVKNIVKIADYFDCSIDFIIGTSDNRKSQFKEYNKNLFYPRYEKLLRENGVTHYSLCKELEISKSGLAKWKNGTLPYLDTLCKIATFFSVSVDYLIGRSDKQ